MASTGKTKKKKNKCCPCLSTSALQEDASGKQLNDLEPDEEIKLLYEFGSYLDYIEIPKKSCHKVKSKSKKSEKQWKTQDKQKKNKPDLCKGKENMGTYEENTTKDTDIKKSKLLKKIKHNTETQNQLDCTKRDFCKKQDTTTLPWISVKKKAKKIKLLQDTNAFSGNQENFGERNCKRIKNSKMVHKGNNIQVNQKQLCLPSKQISFITEKGEHKELSHRESSWFQTPCQHAGLDSAVHSLTGGIIAGFKKQRKLSKEVPVCCLLGASATDTNNCTSSIEPLLLSSPAALEIKTYDSEDELNVGSLKDKGASLMTSKTEAVCNSVDQSQELFITQKSFLPVQSPNSNSSFLSVYAQNHAKETSVERSCKKGNYIDTLQFSQASSNREICDEHSQISQFSLTPSRGGERNSAMQERAIQTEDFFSCPAFTSYLLIRERFADCCEKPLDLSLPYRTRSSAGNTGRASCSLKGAGDGAHVSSKHMLEPVCLIQNHPATLALDDKRESDVFTQSRKSDEVKYVQTLLNSSYFFKVKGDSDIGVSRTPLLKPGLVKRKNTGVGETRLEKF
ncbi:uncharacterized protein LOC102570442 isoform X2 [Alligator mississippiensis]|nr:uncharacterized protein LOC102570442 isoform X2 [Alligator mississippiensis]